MLELEDVSMWGDLERLMTTYPMFPVMTTSWATEASASLRMSMPSL